MDKPAVNRFDATSPLLPEILALHGKWRGSREAVICGETRWTWAEFCAANHRLAHGLQAQGVEPGDRVAILMSNGLSMVQAIYGVMASGACSVPINLSVNDEALGGMLADSGAVALIATADQAARLRASDVALPETLRLLVSDCLLYTSDAADD